MISPAPLDGTWTGESLSEVWRRPWPHQRHSLLNRLIGRSVTSIVRGVVLRIEGLENIACERDPWILVLNHNQKIEAFVLPAILIHWRGGKTVHFLCDWNYFLIPVVAMLLRRSGTIPVMRKHARPAFLNAFKPYFLKRYPPAMKNAKEKLLAGEPVGIFPEGRANRHPGRLLRGQPGAARLSLETGAPIVPGAIRFPRHDPEFLVPDGEPMELHLGTPLAPPATPTTFRHLRAPAAEVQAWHDHVMETLAALSGKRWLP